MFENHYSNRRFYIYIVKNDFDQNVKCILPNIILFHQMILFGININQFQFFFYFCYCSEVF